MRRRKREVKYREVRGLCACGAPENAQHTGNETRLERAMPQSRSSVFDDFNKLVNDATEVAQGMRREAESVVKAQAERFLSAMDVVSREEFEALREMAIAARD
jgi:BMFP domain-containing protein YqiC